MPERLLIEPLFQGMRVAAKRLQFGRSILPASVWIQALRLCSASRFSLAGAPVPRGPTSRFHLPELGFYPDSAESWNASFLAALKSHCSSVAQESTFSVAGFKACTKATSIAKARRRSVGTVRVQHTAQTRRSICG